MVVWGRTMGASNLEFYSVLGGEFFEFCSGNSDLDGNL